MPKPKFIDLFSGCGGLSLGLKMAGFEHVLAVEKSDMAAETYYHNIVERIDDGKWKKHLASDLSEQKDKGLVVNSLYEVLANKDVMKDLSQQDIDLVAGGPPCQGFSLAGKRRGIDARNNLPWQFLEFVRQVKPKIVLVENVAGMNTRSGVNKDSKTPFEELADAVQGAGYSVQKMKLNAMHYGVPQHRPRVFLVGVRKDLSGHPDFSKVLWSSSGPRVCPLLGLKPSKDRITVQEALGDIGDDDYLPEGHTSPYAKLMKTMKPVIFVGAAKRNLNNQHLRSHNPRTKERFNLYHYLSDMDPSLVSLVSLPAKAFRTAKNVECSKHEEWNTQWQLEKEGTVSIEWDREHSGVLNDAWNRGHSGFEESAIRSKEKWIRQEKEKYVRRNWTKKYGELWDSELQESIRLLKSHSKVRAESIFGLSYIVEKAYDEVSSKLDEKQCEYGLDLTPEDKESLIWRTIELTTLKHSQRPLIKNLPSPTIVSIPDDFVHPWKARTMTVRELARLQSFPDWFEFCAKETTGGANRRKEVPQYTQVGNAVAPLLAKAVGKALKKLL